MGHGWRWEEVAMNVRRQGAGLSGVQGRGGVGGLIQDCRWNLIPYDMVGRLVSVD